MAAELILILGGACSGKSSYAERLALELGGPDVLCVATAPGSGRLPVGYTRNLTAS